MPYVSGLTAVAGAIIVMGVAASAATAFHYTIISHVSEQPDTPHTHIILKSIYPGTHQVHADIASEYSIRLGGAISNITLPPHYTGILNTTRPVWPGDTIHITIHHTEQNSESVMQVRVQ